MKTATENHRAPYFNAHKPWLEFCARGSEVQRFNFGYKFLKQFLTEIKESSNIILKYPLGSNRCQYVIATDSNLISDVSFLALETSVRLRNA